MLYYLILAKPYEVGTVTPILKMQIVHTESSLPESHRCQEWRSSSSLAPRFLFLTTTS